MLAKLAGGKGKVALTNCAPGLLALDLRVKGAKEGATKGGLEVVNVYNTNPSRHGGRAVDRSRTS